MLRNYFIIAWRNLTRNKVYSFINIAGLGMGLACAMLIILYVKDEVSYDRFHKNVGNIYRVVITEIDKAGNKSGKNSNTGYLQGPQFAKNIPGIQSFARVQSWYADVKNGTEVKAQEMLGVDSSFFSMFSFPLLSGDRRTCLKDPYSVVISEDVAKRQFGTTDAVGKLILLRDDSLFVPYKVTAVAKKSPQNSSFKFEMLLPFKMAAAEEQNKENWFNFFLNTFVVLKPGAGVQGVETSMNRIFRADAKDAVKTLTQKYGPMDWTNEYHLQAFTGMHLSPDLPAQNGLSDASNPLYSYILSGIAMFILLIACINFVNRP